MKNEKLRVILVGNDGKTKYNQCVYDKMTHEDELFSADNVTDVEGLVNLFKDLCENDIKSYKPCTCSLEYSVDNRIVIYLDGMELN